MDNLEEIIELEEQLKGGLLSDNYYKLKEENEWGNMQTVSRYIKLVESVSGKDFDFVKQLTKVGDNLCQKYRFNVEKLERLYHFNLEGLILADELKDERDEDHLSRVKAHLLAYAGNAARRLLKRTGQMKWGKNWLECYKKSGEMARESEPKHAGFAYGFAGDAATHLFEMTNDYKWLVECYNYSIASAQIFKVADKNYAGQEYRKAGLAADKLYKKFKDPSLLEQSKRSFSLARKFSYVHNSI